MLGVDSEMECRQIVGVKTFTVRELDREPSLVLNACDREGEVKIRRRDGRTYTVKADAGPNRITKVPDIRGRLRKLFPKSIPPTQRDLVDKLLGGE